VIRNRRLAAQAALTILHTTCVIRMSALVAVVRCGYTIRQLCCAIVSGLKDSRSNLISPALPQVPGEQMMAVRPVAAARPRPTYSAKVLSGVDQDAGIIGANAKLG